MNEYYWAQSVAWPHGACYKHVGPLLTLELKEKEEQKSLNSIYGHPQTTADKICPDIQSIKSFGVHIEDTLQ